VPVYEWPAVSVLAGIGLVEGLRLAGLDNVCLKWPNDCLVEGRKLAGTLAEAYPDHGFVVLGIGINVCFGETGPPGDLTPIVTDLEAAMQAGSCLEEACALAMNGAVNAYKSSLPSMKVEPDRAAVLLWTDDTVSVGGVEGRVKGIDTTGALVMETPDGTNSRVVVGEVEDAGCD